MHIHQDKNDLFSTCTQEVPGVNRNNVTATSQVWLIYGITMKQELPWHSVCKSHDLSETMFLLGCWLQREKGCVNKSLKPSFSPAMYTWWAGNLSDNTAIHHCLETKHNLTKLKVYPNDLLALGAMASRLSTPATEARPLISKCNNIY